MYNMPAVRASLEMTLSPKPTEVLVMIDQYIESSADQPSLRWAKTAPLSTSAASDAAECIIDALCRPCPVAAELPMAVKRRVLLTLACMRPSTTPRLAENSDTPVTT